MSDKRLTDIENELAMTYRVLFTSSGIPDQDIECYCKLQIPPWMTRKKGCKLWQSLNRYITNRRTLNARDYSRKAHFRIGKTVKEHPTNIKKLLLHASGKNDSSCTDVDLDTVWHLQDLLNPHSFKNPSTEFSKYPLFKDRLRLIKAYLDAQALKSGMRILWHDTRNKKEWYTIWAVIILGGVSTVIALLALAVSVA